MNIFVLAYDISRVGQANPQLLAFIKMNKIIEGWTSPFDGLVILSSKSSLEEVATMFYEYFGESANFTLTNADKGSLVGVLAPQVWEWVDSNIGKSTPLPAPFPKSD